MANALLSFARANPLFCLFLTPVIISVLLLLSPLLLILSVFFFPVLSLGAVGFATIKLVEAYGGRSIHFQDSGHFLEEKGGSGKRDGSQGWEDLGGGKRFRVADDVQDQMPEQEERVDPVSPKGPQTPPRGDEAPSPRVLGISPSQELHSDPDVVNAVPAFDAMDLPPIPLDQPPVSASSKLDEFEYTVFPDEMALSCNIEDAEALPVQIKLGTAESFAPFLDDQVLTPQVLVTREASVSESAKQVLVTCEESVIESYTSTHVVTGVLADEVATSLNSSLLDVCETPCETDFVPILDIKPAVPGNAQWSSGSETLTDLNTTITPAHLLPSEILADVFDVETQIPLPVPSVEVDVSVSVDELALPVDLQHAFNMTESPVSSMNQVVTDKMDTHSDVQDSFSPSESRSSEFSSSGVLVPQLAVADICEQGFSNLTSPVYSLSVPLDRGLAPTPTLAIDESCLVSTVDGLELEPNISLALVSDMETELGASECSNVAGLDEHVSKSVNLSSPLVDVEMAAREEVEITTDDNLEGPQSEGFMASSDPAIDWTRPNRSVPDEQLDGNVADETCPSLVSRSEEPNANGDAGANDIGLPEPLNDDALGHETTPFIEKQLDIFVNNYDALADEFAVSVYHEFVNPDGWQLELSDFIPEECEMRPNGVAVVSSESDDTLTVGSDVRQLEFEAQPRPNAVGCEMEPLALEADGYDFKRMEQMVENEPRYVASELVQHDNALPDELVKFDDVYKVLQRDLSLGLPKIEAKGVTSELVQHDDALPDVASELEQHVDALPDKLVKFDDVYKVFQRDFSLGLPKIEAKGVTSELMQHANALRDESVQFDDVYKAQRDPTLGLPKMEQPVESCPNTFASMGSEDVDLGTSSDSAEGTSLQSDFASDLELDQPVALGQDKVFVSDLVSNAVDNEGSTALDLVDHGVCTPEGQVKAFVSSLINNVVDDERTRDGVALGRLDHGALGRLDHGAGTPDEMEPAMDMEPSDIKQEPKADDRKQDDVGAALFPDDLVNNSNIMSYEWQHEPETLAMQQAMDPNVVTSEVGKIRDALLEEQYFGNGEHVDTSIGTAADVLSFKWQPEPEMLAMEPEAATSVFGKTHEIVVPEELDFGNGEHIAVCVGSTALNDLKQDDSGDKARENEKLEKSSSNSDANDIGTNTVEFAIKADDDAVELTANPDGAVEVGPLADSSSISRSD